MTDWPRLMKRQTAAAYCDLSVAAFERGVNAGRFPMPVRLERDERWCRKALDKALDQLTGNGPIPSHLARFEERYGPKTAQPGSR
jgi:predicted DNA-binding transcriptional regulator AlpA